MDHRLRKYLVQQNIYTCKFGVYQNFPVMKSQKNFFNENFNMAPPYEYANVVINMKHPIDVAYEFTKIGNKPAIVNTVSKDFSGTNIDTCDGFLDPFINIRTSFNKTLNSFNLFPVKDGEAVYAPIAYIIRNDSMQLLPPGQIGKISMITVSLDSNLELKPYKNTKKSADLHFTQDDYIKVSQSLEAVFQTAIIGGNDILIFNDFGCKTSKYPIDDVIDMFNTCIYKYGHMFKHIVLATFASPQSDMGYITKFNENIIHPQSIIQEFMENEKTLMNELEHSMNYKIDSEPLGQNIDQNENIFNPFIQDNQNINQNMNQDNQNINQSQFNHVNNNSDDKDENELKMMKKILVK